VFTLALTARLAACWNACLGIEDPEALRQQRDDLLTGLENLYCASRVGRDLHNSGLSEVQSTTRKLIAAAKEATP